LFYLGGNELMKNKTIFLYSVILLLVCLSLYFMIMQRRGSEFVKESSLNKTHEAPKEADMKKRKLIKAPAIEYPEIKEKVINSDFAKEGYRDISEGNSVGHTGPGFGNELEDNTPDYTGSDVYAPGMEIEPPGSSLGFENELIEAPESNSAEYIGEAPESNSAEYIGEAPESGSAEDMGDEGTEFNLPDMLIEPLGPGPGGENELRE